MNSHDNFIQECKAEITVMLQVDTAIHTSSIESI